MINHKVAL